MRQDDEPFDAIVAAVAHDFNNLLSVIIGRCEVLLADEAASDPNVLRGHVEVIRQAALDGASLTRRLQERRSEPGLCEVDLVTVLRGAADLTRLRLQARAALAQRPIELEIDAEPIPPVISDPAALREVLVNLIFNAVDAMPRGGTITLRLRSAEGEALIVVSDTGTGIPPALQQHVFERGFTTKPNGHGIGLSGARALVGALGGALDLASVPGRGATFTIRLPVAGPPPATLDGGQPN